MIHNIISYVLFGVTHAIAFWTMTEREFSVKMTAAIYSLFSVIFSAIPAVLNIVFGENPVFYTIGYISTIAFAFIVFVLASSDPICKKLFLFVSYANVFSILGTLSVVISVNLFKSFPELAVYYARNIIRTVLFIPMIFIYIRYLRPAVRIVSGKRRKTWYSISFVSVLFLIIFAMFMIVFYSGYGNAKVYLPLFVISVLLYAAVLSVIFGTVRSMINESNAELTRQNVIYLQGQLENAKENELYNKTVRHDIRHHNNNVAAMLKSGDIKGALKYIEEYNLSLDSFKQTEFCPHVTVNAILNSFYSKATSDGIKVSVSADTKPDIGVSDTDLVAILSNILENAINGCKESEKEKEISVNIKTVSDKTVIVCSNPCKDGLEVENLMIKQKGIGISSILISARKYNGDISYRTDNGRLTVCVILKPKKVSFSNKN